VLFVVGHRSEVLSVRRNLFACLLLSLAATALDAAPDQIHGSSSSVEIQDLQERQRLVIRVQPGGWSTATPAEVEAVLYSVATELLSHFPATRLYPIVVSHSHEAPAALYERGAKGEYRVHLTAKGREWSHYAYEFAHELSHILTNYQHHVDLKMTSHHQWFEETLCEVASLYVLKRLATTWQTAPPYADWQSYAPEFQAFVERFLNEPHRQMPRNQALRTWFAERSGALRESPYVREHNEVVANVLLPLFEENPRIWGAIAYLNLVKTGADFREYLQSWYDNAPEEHRDLIQYLMGLFGVLDEGGELQRPTAPTARQSEQVIDERPPAR
jgi:hypothetical protein